MILFIMKGFIDYKKRGIMSSLQLKGYFTVLLAGIFRHYSCNMYVKLLFPEMNQKGK